MCHCDNDPYFVIVPKLAITDFTKCRMRAMTYMLKDLMRKAKSFMVTTISGIALTNIFKSRQSPASLYCVGSDELFKIQSIVLLLQKKIVVFEQIVRWGHLLVLAKPNRSRI